MTKYATLARMSAAALIGLSIAASGLTPALADRMPVKDQTGIDRTTTGSVYAADAKFCDPNDPKADIVCKVTRGERDVRFPSAPSNLPLSF
ncbi:MAG: hypothetical protein WAU86_03420 [Oricola sp.]